MVLQIGVDGPKIYTNIRFACFGYKKKGDGVSDFGASRLMKGKKKKKLHCLKLLAILRN